MFTWVNKQCVRSTDGFEVQTTGRFTIEYREGEHVLTLNVEPGLSGARPLVLIDQSQFEYWDNSFVRNSAVEQARMLANFTAAMEFQGMGVDA